MGGMKAAPAGTPGRPGLFGQLRIQLDQRLMKLPIREQIVIQGIPSSSWWTKEENPLWTLSSRSVRGFGFSPSVTLIKNSRKEHQKTCSR
jgi:hypothetical protein